MNTTDKNCRLRQRIARQMAAVDKEAALALHRVVPVERGAASIIISLTGGNITVTHGEAGVVLARGEQVPDGTWLKLWAAIDALGVKRVVP